MVSATDTAVEVPTALPEVTGERKSRRFLRRIWVYACIVGPWLVPELVLKVLDFAGKGSGLLHWLGLTVSPTANPTAVLLLTPHYLWVIPLAHHFSYPIFLIIAYSRQMIGR